MHFLHFQNYVKHINLLLFLFVESSCGQLIDLPIKRLSFSERAGKTQNPVAKHLLKIIGQKKTNLCVAIDVSSKSELLDIIEQVGPYVCCIKTHIDIIDDFDFECVKQLRALADKYNFLIIEDRKFCDIGATVQQQYVGGIHKIAQWADIIIAHAISGPDIIKALEFAKGINKNQCGLLLVAQMSSAGNLIDAAYTKRVVEMAETNTDFVIGLVCQERCGNKNELLYFTPGVHLATASDAFGQQYNTPAKAIKQQKTDIIIVGRGICQASDIRKAAEEYKNNAWHAYLDTL